MLKYFQTIYIHMCIHLTVPILSLHLSPAMCQLLPPDHLPDQVPHRGRRVWADGLSIFTGGWGLALGVFFMEVAAGIVFIVAPRHARGSLQRKDCLHKRWHDGVIVLVSSLEAFLRRAIRRSSHVHARLKRYMM